MTAPTPSGILAKSLQEHLRSEQEAMLALLARLVEAESPSSDRAALDRVLGILDQVLSDTGFAVRRITGSPAPNLFARPQRRRAGAPAQLLLGHCDTVWPQGTLASMPWASDRQIASGPGVYDMKAGLVQMIFALRALRALGVEPVVRPLVLINSDEETGSRGSTRHIERLAPRVERIFVLEPSLGPEGKLKTSRKGTGRFTIQITGKAAHAGLEPERGASAILELSYVVQELFALNDAERGISVNVGLIDGGLRPNVIAPTSSAVVDLRVERSTDAAEVVAAMHRIKPRIPGVEISITGHLGRPPMEPTARNQKLFDTARGYAAELGFDLEGATAGGSSDGNTASLHAATLDGLGAVGEGAHAHHEKVYVEHLVERAALLGMLLNAPSQKAETTEKEARG